MLLVFQLALLGLASSASIKFTLKNQDTSFENENLSMDKCWPLMESVGLSARFPGAVSHAIHSLTLEDLRHNFDPQAQENNGIPIINLDLSAEEMLLPNAPSNGLRQSFMTLGLRAVDQVLSHMDNRDYDLAYYTTLERLVHALHMQEVWEMMRKYYSKLMKNPPKDPRVCQCAKNVDQNGVKKFLSYMALKIRYPQVMYGKSLEMSQEDPESFQFHKDASNLDLHKPGNKPNYNWDGNLYTYNFQKNHNKSEEDEAEEEKNSSSVGKYDWDGNIYEFHLLNSNEKTHNRHNSGKQKRNAKGNYDWDGNLYTYNFAKENKDAKDTSNKDEPKKNAKGSYDWDGNLYTYNFAKGLEDTTDSSNTDKPKENIKGSYKWDGNLYTYNFAKGSEEANDATNTKNLKGNTKGSYDWDGNLYTYNFAKDSKEAKEATSTDEMKQNNSPKVDQDGNIYTFKFAKKSNEAKDASNVEKQKGNTKGNYDWDGNLYTYNFAKDGKGAKDSTVTDEHQRYEEEQFEAQKPDGKVLEPWQIKDKGMIHLKNESSWKVWKKAMMDMDDHDHFEAAFFLYCMLN